MGRHLAPSAPPGLPCAGAWACACAFLTPLRGRAVCAGRPGYDKRRMLVHVLVAGSAVAAERLLRDVPVLFSTIEDFMWSVL